ncbi:MAG: hypothetical protein J6Y07_04100 [Alphaproteobacteria bacterium]|nr:hypothetical protein [Alphaproteobacteria bacterium]
MVRVLSERQLEKQRAEEDYLKKLDELLGLIPESSIFKKVSCSKVDGVIVSRSTKWSIANQYKLDSCFRIVYSVEAFDINEPWLLLKATDYRKVVKACSERHKVLAEQHKKKR